MQIKQANAVSRVTTPPTESSSDYALERLGQVLRAWRRKFPPISDERAEEELSDWRDLVKRFGLERFEAGAVQARNWKMDFKDGGDLIPREFFPQASEIERFIPGPQAKTAFADPNCRICNGSGRQIVERDGKRMAELCGCKQR
jgi:hypothetical protein